MVGTTLGGSVDAAFREATVIYRRMGGSRVPWLLLTQSAVLQEVGHGAQYGLYPLRAFASAERITDRYAGSVVYSTSDLEGGEAEHAIAALLQGGMRSLCAVTRDDGSGLTDIVQGEGLPHVWAVNAATGTRHGVRARFNRRGRLVATRRSMLPTGGEVQGAELQAYLRCGLAALAQYELLVLYGRAYWDGLRRSERPKAAGTGAKRRRGGGGGGATGLGGGSGAGGGDGGGSSGGERQTTTASSAEWRTTRTTRTSTADGDAVAATAAPYGGVSGIQGGRTPGATQHAGCSARQEVESPGPAGEMHDLSFRGAPLLENLSDAHRTDSAAAASTAPAAPIAPDSAADCTAAH